MDIRYYLAKGQSLINSDKLSEASKEYQKVLQIDSANAEAQEGLRVRQDILESWN